MSKHDESGEKALWGEFDMNFTPPKDVKVAWAMPTYGPIYPQVYSNHLAVVAYASRYLTMERIGEVPIIGTTDRMYLHTACNKTVKAFLESDCTHIFWTESDMIMPFYTIPKLLSHGVQFTTGVYFLRNGGGQPCLYMRGEMSVHTGVYGAVPVSVFPEDSLFKVHASGMGVALIHRSVFEAIDPPWFDLKEGWHKVDGKILGYGQDIYFASKVSTAGVDVWVDSSIHCSQVTDGIINILDYRESIANKDFKADGAVITGGEGEGSAKDAPIPI